MMINSTIIQTLKSRIQQVLPAAKIVLFGSRTTGAATEESDWDILVLTSQPVTPSIKKQVHDLVFPLSVQLGAFINTLIVQEDDWTNNPSYYALRQTALKDMMQL